MLNWDIFFVFFKRASLWIISYRKTVLESNESKGFCFSLDLRMAVKRSLNLGYAE
jgi:hypothetical protein